MRRGPRRLLAKETKKPAPRAPVLVAPEATMMKVRTRSSSVRRPRLSRALLRTVRRQMAALGVNPNSGLATCSGRSSGNAQIMAAIERPGRAPPPLHGRSATAGSPTCTSPDVIIDASMPRAHPWRRRGVGADGKEHDTVCVTPTIPYPPVYDEAIAFFKENGKLNPATAGTGQNSGSWRRRPRNTAPTPRLSRCPPSGTVKMILDDAPCCIRTRSRAGDIWRSASTRKGPSRIG